MSPDIGKDHFEGKPDAGLIVYYWPKGDVERNNENVRPLVGVVHKGWDLGVADINILPGQEGALGFLDNCMHIGDPRCLNHVKTGLSNAARVRGIWELAPISKFYMALKDHLPALLTLSEQLAGARAADKESEPNKNDKKPKA